MGNLWSSDMTAMISFGIVFSIIWVLTCFTIFCKWLCKSSPTSSEEPIEISPTQTPAFVPPMPSAPPPALSLDPPPYSEVAFKPNIWPLVDHLPAYDNIAMDHLPSMDMSQQPRPMPKAFGYNV